MNREEQRLALIRGLDDPVRRRLYDFVSACGEQVGRDEAAAATGIGRPLVAYHLDRLVSLGLLTADYRRPGGRTGPGAGRPAKVYTRSGSEFAVTVPPREYELAARLLVEAVESEPSGWALAGLRRAARRHGSEIGRAARGRLPARGGGQHSSPREIMHATLAEHGFEPVTDADSISLRNCPFHPLAARHRDVVCAMNLALLDGVATGIGGSDLHPVLDPAPGRCCVVVRADGRPTTREPEERHDA
jgi:predicted ArsR family transcriptional regulator